jgi:hypothetical protein
MFSGEHPDTHLKSIEEDEAKGAKNSKSVEHKGSRNKAGI